MFRVYDSKEQIKAIQYNFNNLPFIRPWLSKLGLIIEIEDQTFIQIGNAFNNKKLLCEKDSYICVNEEGVFILKEDLFNKRYKLSLKGN